MTIKLDHHHGLLIAEIACNVKTGLVAIDADKSGRASEIGRLS
jgi:hypothetical protein